jgi:hypothetical protein
VGLWDFPDPGLAAAGKAYHAHRSQLMRSLWLGLTDIYNLFHAQALDADLVARVSGKPFELAKEGVEGLLELRRLHVALDHAVLNAYGWQDLDLGHGFFEVETLPEKDRVRFTLSPQARREVLRRLLVLNREQAAMEKREEAISCSVARRAQVREMRPGECGGNLFDAA